jgi:simple sugar transport system permease protein
MRDHDAAGHKLRGVLEQLLSVALALGLASLVLLLTGYDATGVVASIGRSFTADLGGTIRWATPLILTGLGTCIAFRGRVWNIGLDGQIYLGAIFSAWIGLGLVSQLPAIVAIPLVLLSSMFGGLLWAAIPGLLRVLWGAPEIITTIILIPVAELLTDWVVLGPLRGNAAVAATLATNPLGQQLWLVSPVAGSQANIGFLIAVSMALLTALFLFRSTYGYELAMLGESPRFSFFGGIDNPRVFMRAMLMSGALGGLAGGLEVLGVVHRLAMRFNPGLGFDGIAVSLVASNQPLAIVASGVFFGALRTGGNNLQRLTDTPRDIVSIVSAVVILAVTARIGQRLIRAMPRVTAARAVRLEDTA